MSKKGVVIWVAVGLIVLGLLISVTVLTICRFDFMKLTTEQSFEQHQYIIEDNVKNIEISELSREVRILPSEDDKTHVICYENEKEFYDINVKNQTLSICYKNEKLWYERIGVFISLQDRELIVYVPQAEYDKIQVTNVSGHIKTEIPAQQILLTTTSGDVSLNADAQTLSVKSVSGKILIDAATISGKAELRTTSGRISLSAFHAQELISHSVSGSIYFEACDAQRLSLKTTSGDVSGTLLSPKQFSVSTVSGKIHVPQSDSVGGYFDASTVSGSVDITIL